MFPVRVLVQGNPPKLLGVLHTASPPKVGARYLFAANAEDEYDIEVLDTYDAPVNEGTRFEATEPWILCRILGKRQT
jgi:hypothetical protein